MPKWIITPDKFLSEEEVKRLRKACEEASIIAKSKQEEWRYAHLTFSHSSTIAEGIG